MNNLKIHMIGICGIAMGALACMLRDQGHEVSGSDMNVYPPMSDLLADSGIVVHNGYSEEHINVPDLVIIGNAVSRGNPEAELVLNRKIPYMSMARALYDFFLRHKNVIAVAGTHGKSTTTALVAHILSVAGLCPSCFVGGFINNYNANYLLGEGEFFVIEGDEYDSAFFEKVPKFIFYRPDNLILTSLEYDHADIYGSLEEIELWFRRLVKIVPSQGCIAYSSAYLNLAGIAEGSFSRTVCFGANGAEFSCRFTGMNGNYACLEITGKDGLPFTVRSRLLGDYNFSNITAAACMCLNLGVDHETVAMAVESFTGVKRRQELIYCRSGITIYEDFAHHPTAVRAVLSCMKEYYRDSTLWALYEPRSATGRRNVFQDSLPGAFLNADRVVIKSPGMLDSIPVNERLDPDKVRDDIEAAGGSARVFGTVEEIIKFVTGEINPDSKNIIVIMSNGGFDNIYDRIRAAFDSMIN